MAKQFVLAQEKALVLALDKVVRLPPGKKFGLDQGIGDRVRGGGQLFVPQTADFLQDRCYGLPDQGTYRR